MPTCTELNRHTGWRNRILSAALVSAEKRQTTTSIRPNCCLPDRSYGGSTIHTERDIHQLYGNGTAQHNREKPGAVELFGTGIAGLDDILGGGLARNHLYLLEGEPGTGKTTIALQFLLEGARHGQTGLYVTLSESKVELLEIAESHGWSLDPIEIFEMAPDEDELKPEAQYTVFNLAEIELGDTTTAVLSEVERLQPTRVVFDSLSELRLLARDSLRYRRQIMGLKRYFSGRNCTVLLLDDRTSERHDLQLESIAHGVIMMESVEREYGIKRRRLEVKKLRGSWFREGFHDYTIKRGGVEVYPRLVASEHRLEYSPTQLKSGLAAAGTRVVERRN